MCIPLHSHANLKLVELPINIIIGSAVETISHGRTDEWFTCLMAHTQAGRRAANGCETAPEMMMMITFTFATSFQLIHFHYLPTHTQTHSFPTKFVTPNA